MPLSVARSHAKEAPDGTCVLAGSGARPPAIRSSESGRGVAAEYLNHRHTPTVVRSLPRCGPVGAARRASVLACPTRRGALELGSGPQGIMRTAPVDRTGPAGA